MKEGDVNPVKDYELEILASKDEKTAIAYIGDSARSKNIFQGNKKSKRKNNRFDDYLPLFAEKQLTLF